MLVGTVSRAQLVTFLQSHEHPQAPPGEKVNWEGGGGSEHRTTPKKVAFPPQN